MHDRWDVMHAQKHSWAQTCPSCRCSRMCAVTANALPNFRQGLGKPQSSSVPQAGRGVGDMAAPAAVHWLKRGVGAAAVSVPGI